MIEWAVSSKPFPGQVVSGDQCLVKTLQRGAIAAVVDALGHGTNAARAAQAAVDAIRSSADQPIERIVHACHGALGRLRGAVMSLASFDDASATLSWVGIGNVEGLLLPGSPVPLRPRERLLTRGGVVGGSLPEFRVATLPIRHGDVVVFATDGLRVDFADRLRVGANLQSSADSILEAERTGTDDALVLLARWTRACNEPG